MTKLGPHFVWPQGRFMDDRIFKKLAKWITDSSWVTKNCIQSPPRRVWDPLLEINVWKVTHAEHDRIELSTSTVNVYRFGLFGT